MAFKMKGNPFKQNTYTKNLVSTRLKKCPICGKVFSIRDGGAASPQLNDDGGYADHIKEHRTNKPMDRIKNE